MDYPELVVFDLDACFWDQEMYEMSALPEKTVMGDLNGTIYMVYGQFFFPSPLKILYVSNLDVLVL